LQKKAKPSIWDIRLEDIRPEDIRNGHHDPKGLDTFVERNPPKRNTKPENSASKNASNGK
jgi:hypothetical protein